MLTTICSRLHSVFVAAVLALLVCPIAPPAHGSAQTERVENFRLFDHEGKAHELRRYGDRKAVVLFIAGNGCPIVRQTLPMLEELREVYGEEGISFLLLNANPQDDRPAIAEEAESFSITFPILIDRAQLIARSLEIHRTGKAILISPANGEILYRGAVDDSLDYGTVRPAANYSSFSNDRSLSIEEKQALITWIEAGAPRGEGEDPLLQNSASTPACWALGEPDHVVSLPEEVTLPATGLIDYKYFRVPSNFDEDAWIRAIDIRPGRPRICWKNRKRFPPERSFSVAALLTTPQ